MQQIPLSGSGQFAPVDDADFELASRYKWHLRRSSHRKTCYASAYTPDGEIHLHRLILQPKPGQLVDHRDGDGLNNTRANLRVCSVAENNANRRPRSKTGFKGVVPSAGRWRAKIKHQGRNAHLGIYDTPEEAARAYDAAALQLYGEFAHLNFPAERQAVSA